VRVCAEQVPRLFGCVFKAELPGIICACVSVEWPFFSPSTSLRTGWYCVARVESRRGQGGVGWLPHKPWGSLH
jgi:hypothetical protein